MTGDARGWVCPTCGSGVSPWVTEHCAKAATTPSIGAHSSVVWNCSLCGAWVGAGKPHACPATAITTAIT